MGNDWRNAIWCIIDTETTGLDLEEDRICEVGVTRYRRGEGYLSRHHSLFNPGIPIPAEATEVHGITDAMVAFKPTLAVLAEPLKALFADSDVVLGYNIYGYDEHMFRNGFGTDVWTSIVAGKPIIDVIAIVRMDRVGRYWKGKGRHKLKNVAARYGIAVDEEHRGLADTDTTTDVLSAMIDREPGADSIPKDGKAAEVMLREVYRRDQEQYQRWLASQPPKDEGNSK